ncbi:MULTISPECIES: UvrD-helicase domain-containing protein [unclassified Iodidimonas]|jgi:DNA helicase-2/ATP-dependent DNA helicase PcrA|uniref:ATP-dependent helicase n=1 Tax=unclassified Iodidimonas TaxID=2626145 RepID=UPI002482CE45|nr:MULTISPECIES: UvrD-helicase domain-containing protein [unclassified Iodidimonas]
MNSDPFDFQDDAPSGGTGAASGAASGANPAGEPPWLSGLNPAQRDAVLSLLGPVLVLAGAGTGKTRVLTTRIAHLIATGHAHPGEILAVTFTNKAAREMRERVEHLLGRPAAGMALGTFHSISARWLRHYAERAGLKSNFTILDSDDQIRLLKQLIRAEDIDEKRWPARLLAGLIDRWKNRALTPQTVPRAEAMSFAEGKGLSLYRQYQERLLQINACDFGDLILHMITLMQNHRDILASIQRRARFLLVDEYQDTNVAQYLWLRLLAQRPETEPRHICCVGDDDQSIYGWRGAEVGNILRFDQDFPGAKVIRLEQNYRSTGHILGAASSLIAANASRLGKSLWTEAGAGEKIDLRGLWDANEEARTVGDLVEDRQRQGDPLSEMAILVRAGFQTREFEERMITLGIPYRVIGGPRFYERAEIRDALAYLRLLVQPDDDLAFERIINLPKRGLGTAALQMINRLARAEGTSMSRAAAQLIGSEDLRPQARRALAHFLEDFKRWREQIDQLDHPGLTELILEESGIVEMWQKDKSPDASGRLENLRELVGAMREFDSLNGFLEHISLVMDNQEASGLEKLTIMTLHAAKGLEFDTVFLPGWEEGVFPNQRAMDEGGLSALEEERRLGYVGITRAKKRAIILFAANRQIFGQWQSSLPSRFIEDLDPQHIEEHLQQGLYGQSRSPRMVGDQSWDGGKAWGGFQGYDTEPARGPGWARAQAHGARQNVDGRGDRVRRSSRRAHGLQGMGLQGINSRKSGHPSADQAAAPAFTIGERVFHEKFGYGEIIEISGHKLHIDFEHSGVKHVLDSFVTSS